MFRRTTDQFIKQHIGKQPLDIGADRIARTVHAALSFLETLRKATGEAIPLVWEPALLPGIQVIEVYPTATLIACGITVPTYKGKEGREARKTLLKLLGEHITLPADTSLMENNDNALDAAICVLAAADFLSGLVLKPTNQDFAMKEGWIWVRQLRK